jgi:hypothetical protein
VIRIIGGGMAGLLAARMLSRHRPVIYERAHALPHNHSAVLRFATSQVADVLGIPFKRVLLSKVAIPWRNPVADALAYSHKVLGEYRSDRSIVLPERQTTERWIAPENLIEQMAEGVNIEYGVDYDFQPDQPKVISTIPMPELAERMGHRDLGWKWVAGTNVTARIKHCDAYASVVVPDPKVVFYRASITGDKLIVEATGDGSSQMSEDPEGAVVLACMMLGVTRDVFENVSVHASTYAKIAPIDEAERRNFIFWASTMTGRAYQLGRYATWRPRLLLDDLVHDVRLIESWMVSASSQADQEKHEATKRRG